MNVTLWSIDRPIPYARNARRIPQNAIDKVSASIKEFGWRQPIVVDSEGVIIAGHTRLLAARKLGLSEVPVHIAEGLTAAQIKAYRLMDNRSHQEAEWDDGLLGPELIEIRDLDFDLELTGFNADELAAFFDERTSPEENEASVTLSDRFGVPPFSVLDARQGYWQERKRKWLALGIESEVGRGDALPGGGADLRLRHAGCASE